MGTHVIRNINGKVTDIQVLKELNSLYEQYTDIRETNYLQDFSFLESTNTFNPNYVIRKILQLYVRNVALIHCHPDLLQKFTFMLHEEGKDKWTFEFSNDMNLIHDIITMCYFYYISHKSEFNQCQSVKLLRPLLLDKYDVFSIQEANTQFMQQRETVISLLDIALSFPSITWEIVCNLELWTGVFKHVSDFNLPKQALLTPFIFSLLPILEEKPPLAILLALSLKTNEFRQVKSPSLRIILNDITLCYESKIYPQRLKLELCEKWQIVMQEEGIYKYTPCFAMHRHKAKNIIATMKSDDPDLELILSKL